MSFGPEPPTPYRDADAAPDSTTAALPANDSRAVLSMVLGAFSLVTCGMTGIPAVVLGLVARGAIRRSGGALRGAGLAAVGIVSGFAGTVLAALGAGIVMTSVALGSHGLVRRPFFAPSTGSTTSWTAATPSLPTPGPVAIGSIRVVDLDPDSRRTFHQQLGDEFRRAAGAHEMVVVMTSARWCSVCKEFEASLTDARMQGALAEVDLVRVDVDDFDDELRSAGMLERTLPWFYKIDSTLHPVDAISAGEWDDNLAENMAPVLKSFLAGRLRERRDPSALGTSL